GDDGEDPHLQLGLHAIYLGVAGYAALGGGGVLLHERQACQVCSLPNETEHAQDIAGYGFYRLGERAPVGAGRRAGVHDGHDSHRRAPGPRASLAAELLRQATRLEPARPRGPGAGEWLRQHRALYPQRTKGETTSRAARRELL